MCVYVAKGKTSCGARASLQVDNAPSAIEAVIKPIRTNDSMIPGLNPESSRIQIRKSSFEVAMGNGGQSASTHAYDNCTSFRYNTAFYRSILFLCVTTEIIVHIIDCLTIIPHAQEINTHSNRYYLYYFEILSQFIYVGPETITRI